MMLLVGRDSMDSPTSDLFSIFSTVSPGGTPERAGILALSRSILMGMGAQANFSCLYNCSGRGECQEGICLCPVQYHGDSCTDPNMAYFVSFASIFYLVGLVSLGQLVVCVRSEYLRLKTPTVRAACSVTTQKILYIVTCVAALLRGAYFSSPANADLILSSSFVSAFYPIILTGGSLIVCFWAEAFHLRDIRCERPRFLSKSFCGFLTFNGITYALFAAEIVLTRKTDTQEQRSFLTHVFNGCYAVLLFIVVVFFLIYGVEVYFKIRGGFVSDTVIVGNVQSRSSVPARSDSDSPLLSVDSSSASSTSPAPPSSPSSVPPPDSAAAELEEEKGPLTSLGSEGSDAKMNGEFTHLVPQRGLDQSQLHQSRFGLVFQACMLMITVCFLCSDVLGGFWKSKVPLISRNAYDIIFRVVELAVALWFPCVLWNCMSPEQLWILNPKKILKKLDFEKTLELGKSVGIRELESRVDAGECWICYDNESLSAGPMINPCDCKGDVGAVHHNCLKKWLMECAPTDSAESLSCKVCGAAYQLEQRNIWWIGKGFTPRQWLTTAVLVTVMCGAVASFWAAMQLCEDAFKRAIAAGATLIVFYICLRLLGFSFFTGYQRAKMSAARILGSRFSSQQVSSSSAPPPSVSLVSTAASMSELAGVHADRAARPVQRLDIDDPGTI